jgi:hypothetical protein
MMLKATAGDVQDVSIFGKILKLGKLRGIT